MQGYSLAQIEAFAAAVDAQRRQALSDRALAARAAQAEARAFDKFIRELS